MAETARFLIWVIFQRAGELFGQFPFDPQDVAHWLEMAQSLGVTCHPLRERPAFTAVTLHHLDLGWCIYFNRSATPFNQCRYLAHEVAEFLMGDGTVFGLYGTYLCLERAEIPAAGVGSLRHEIASRVVRALFPKACAVHAPARETANRERVRGERRLAGVLGGGERVTVGEDVKGRTPAERSAWGPETMRSLTDLEEELERLPEPLRGGLVRVLLEQTRLMTTQVEAFKEVMNNQLDVIKQSLPILERQQEEGTEG